MVILEVLTGKPPFPNYNGMVVMRKVIEGERPGRPQGEEEVWFTDDLWEVLEQCWSPQPERPHNRHRTSMLKSGFSGLAAATPFSRWLRPTGRR